MIPCLRPSPDAYLSLGYVVLSSRGRLEQFLDELTASAGTKIRGVESVYGHLYSWLDGAAGVGSGNQSASLSPLRDIFAEHALRSFPVDPGEELFGRRRPDWNLYSAEHLAKTLRRSWVPVAPADCSDAVRRILARADLIDKDAVGERHSSFIDPVVAGRLMEKLDGHMVFSELQRWSGIPHKTFFDLQDSELLRPWCTWEGTRPSQDFWLKDQVDDWFARLRGQAPTVGEIQPGALRIKEAASAVRLPFSVVVSALLEGQLHACGVLAGEKPWKAVLVSTEAVRKWASGKLLECGEHRVS